MAAVSLKNVTTRLLMLHEDVREALAANRSVMERAVLKTVQTGLRIALEGSSVSEECRYCGGPDAVTCDTCGVTACGKCQYEAHFPSATDTEAERGEWRCPKAPAPAPVEPVCDGEEEDDIAWGKP